tara:strand:- start:10112 stop:10306 length:195 start_codon:yes stop_codon:yes gene_type:complete
MALIITPDEPNLYASHIKLNENEFNLIAYCLEQQWSEFTPDEDKDGQSILRKLSEITEVDDDNK